jgi:hypothetical protein
VTITSTGGRLDPGLPYPSGRSGRYLCATASISTRAPEGSAAICTVARAG